MRPIQLFVYLYPMLLFPRSPFNAKSYDVCLRFFLRVLIDVTALYSLRHAILDRKSRVNPEEHLIKVETVRYTQVNLIGKDCTTSYSTVLLQSTVQSLSLSFNWKHPSRRDQVWA